MRKITRNLEKIKVFHKNSLERVDNDLFYWLQERAKLMQNLALMQDKLARVETKVQVLIMAKKNLVGNKEGE